MLRMLRRMLAAGVVATVALTAIDLGACGDKFLRPGRSGRWQNYAAMHPAAILLYQSATAKPEVLKAWQAMLKKAGPNRRSFNRVMISHGQLRPGNTMSSSPTTPRRRSSTRCSGRPVEARNASLPEQAESGAGR